LKIKLLYIMNSTKVCNEDNIYGEGEGYEGDPARGALSAHEQAPLHHRHPRRIHDGAAEVGTVKERKRDEGMGEMLRKHPQNILQNTLIWNNSNITQFRQDAFHRDALLRGRRSGRSDEEHAQEQDDHPGGQDIEVVDSGNGIAFSTDYVKTFSNVLFLFRINLDRASLNNGRQL
jgi:hypothetical protein